GIVLHVHESNSDSDYEREEDGNSENKDDDVADDLEAECLDRNSNRLSQCKRPRDSDQEAANVLPDTRPDAIANRTRVVKGHLWQNWFPLTAFRRNVQRIGIIKVSSMYRIYCLLSPYGRATTGIQLAMAMDAYPVNMTDKVLEGREPTATHEKTTATLLDYNFVVPGALVKTMDRVIRTQREKSERSARQQRRHELTGTSLRTASATEPVDIVLSDGGDLKKNLQVRAFCLKVFCEKAPINVSPQFYLSDIMSNYSLAVFVLCRISVFRMVHFYSIKKQLEAWQEDKQWLMKSWNNEIQADLFSIEASDKGNRNDVCAKEALL
ncbi:hypothetical protein GN958_ATG14405, partial [Phytophthora infestans]